MKDLYLVGAGGGPNFGDDLIGKIWVSFLAKRYPERTIWLDTRNAGITASFFAEFKNVKSVDTFWRLRDRAIKREGDFRDKVKYLEDKVKNLGTPQYDIALTHIKNNVESIHFIGGGYVNKIWRNNLLLFELAVALKKQNHEIKLFGTGLGLTPVDANFKNEFLKIKPVFDYIEARDVDSSEELSVTLGIDDVWMNFDESAFLKRPVTKESEDVPEVMVLLQKDFNEDQVDKLFEKAVRMIKSLDNYSRDTVIGVAEAYPSQDYWVLPRLKKVLPNPIKFYSFQHLWQEGFPAGENVTWITTRFHYHLIGSGYGSKGVVLGSGSKYYNVKHRSLLSAGTGWTLSGLDDALIQPTNNSEWEYNVKLLSERKVKLARLLYPSLNAD